MNWQHIRGAIWVVSFVAVFFPASSFAATWYVGVDNADDNVATHGTTSTAPFATFGYAETQAADGDTVIVANGTYNMANLVSAKGITWDGESKDGVILTFTDNTRGIYLNNPGSARTFRDMTFQNNNTDSGPSWLVQQNGNAANTTFDNIKFENGKRSGLYIGAGKTGVTVQNSEFVGNISSYYGAVNAAGGYTIQNSTMTVTDDPTALQGVFYQNGASTGEKITITSNTVSVADNYYTFRMTFGGYNAPEITNNTITVSSTYTRPVIQMKKQTDEIITGNTITIPSTNNGAYGIVLQQPLAGGVVSQATVNSNTIHIYNDGGYGILLGDEGGVDSTAGFYNTSTIQGNYIYGSAYNGEAMGSGHAIMVGYNSDVTVSGNRVEGHGYCIVVKYTGDVWGAGGITENTCVNNTFGIRIKGVSNVSVLNNELFSDNGANTTAFDVTENGVGELSTSTTFTGNIISIDAGEVFNFRDASSDTLTSNNNYFDVFDAGTVGNVNGGAAQSTLANWQANTAHDADSNTWDRDAAPTIQFTSSTRSGTEATEAIVHTIEASGVHPYTMTFDYAVNGASTASGAGVDYTFVDGSGSITAGNTTTTITLNIVGDDIDESDETVIIALSNFASSSIGAAPTTTYTILDNDTAAITITETAGGTAVTEGGATDTYTVVLGSEPTNNVTVGISDSTNETSVSPTSITFTSANWDTAVVVTVTAVDDTHVEGEETATLAHSASSDDANYDGIAIDSVSATITSDDQGVGVAPAPVFDGRMPADQPAARSFVINDDT